MHETQAAMESVIQAVTKEIHGRGVPHEAFIVKPILFSGNYDGHGEKNRPVYGIRVHCMGGAYRETIRRLFEPVKSDPDMVTLQTTPPNAVAHSLSESDHFRGGNMRLPSSAGPGGSPQQAGAFAGKPGDIALHVPGRRRLGAMTGINFAAVSCYHNALLQLRILTYA